MLIFRVPVWRNVTSYQHPVAHHVEASGLFWVSRKHSRLVFVAVAHPVKLFNWGERSLTPGFRSRRMIHFDPNEHDCNPGLSPRLAIVRNGRGLIYGQLFHNRIWEELCRPSTKETIKAICRECNRGVTPTTRQIPNF